MQKTPVEFDPALGAELVQASVDFLTVNPALHGQDETPREAALVGLKRALGELRSGSVTGVQTLLSLIPTLSGLYDHEDTLTLNALVRDAARAYGMQFPVARITPAPAIRRYSHALSIHGGLADLGLL